MLLGFGAGPTADCWSLGVVLYRCKDDCLFCSSAFLFSDVAVPSQRLLAGHTPFNGTGTVPRLDVCKNILVPTGHLTFPSHPNFGDENARSIIKSLLNVNPSLRLGGDQILHIPRGWVGLIGLAFFRRKGWVATREGPFVVHRGGLEPPQEEGAATTLASARLQRFRGRERVGLFWDCDGR